MKEKISKNNLRLSVLSAVVFLGMACQRDASPLLASPQSVEPTKTIPASIIASDSPKTEKQPTSTFFPKVTQTPSPDIWPTVPSAPLKPITPTYLPWTPVPTMVGGRTDEQIHQWLEGTPDCRFPCWAGIIPGETTLEESYKTLGEITELGGVIENGRCLFGSCKGFYWNMTSRPSLEGYVLSDNDHVIYGINIDSGIMIPEYRIEKVLSDYGKPDQIFISTAAFVNDPVLPLRITLVYLKNNLIVRYFWSAKLEGENIIGCKEDGFIHIAVGFGNTSEWTDARIKVITFNGNLVNRYAFGHLEDVTKEDINTFYEKFIGSDNACISTPRILWP